MPLLQLVKVDTLPVWRSLSQQGSALIHRELGESQHSWLPARKDTIKLSGTNEIKNEYQYLPNITAIEHFP